MPRNEAKRRSPSPHNTLSVAEYAAAADGLGGVREARAKERDRHAFRPATNNNPLAATAMCWASR